MHKTLLKISIIIPSYNQGQFLEEAIISVISQHYPNVEIIVMDGGSTDNSVEIIKKYNNYITYWQSQKDYGQSNAINEGFRRATGSFVTWLNSDDVLLNGSLQAVDKTIQNNPQINWFLGNVLWMDRDGRITKVGKVEKENWKWNKHFLLSNGGPSAFIRKSCLQQLGWLREDFHYMMDTELWYRFIKNKHPFVRINQYCWGLRLHEAAKMSGHNFKGSALADKKHPSWTQKRKESEILKSTYFVSSIYLIVWRLLKVLTLTFYSRFSDKYLIGKHYSRII